MSIQRILSGLLVLSCIFISTVSAVDVPKKITCSGKVVDDSNKPVAGAKVTLYLFKHDAGDQESPKPIAEERITKKDGSFSFGAETPPDGPYQHSYLVAQKEDFAIGWDNWSMQEDKVATLTMGKPYTLRGVVVDEAGTPVGGAEVRISMLLIGDPQGGPEKAKILTSTEKFDLLKTTTGDNGIFTFNNIPLEAKAEFTVKKTGKATVSTYKPNQYAPYNPGQYTVQSKDIRIVLPVEAKIEGKVVEKITGKPVGGVKLMCALQKGGGTFGMKPVVSKDDGTFSFDGIEAKTYIVLATDVLLQKQPAQWVIKPVTVTTMAGQVNSGIILEASKGGMLEITINDNEKNPVAKATVYASTKDYTLQGISGVSNAAGIATMRLAPGEYMVQGAYKEGYSSPREPQPVTIEDGKTARLAMVLSGASKITGVVHDAGGRAIAGASLKIYPSGQKAATSDKDGKFEILWNPEQWGRQQRMQPVLIARHAGQNLAAVVDIEDDTKTVDVNMTPGVVFAGVVVDPNGKPIAGAKVTVMMSISNGGIQLDEMGVTADQQGRYEVKAVPQEQKYSISAQADGYGRGNVRADAKDAASNHLEIGQLTLQVAALSISGIVVDVNDKPVANADVSINGKSQQYRRGTTDDLGKFTIDKLCEGQVNVSANVRSGQENRYGNARANAGDTDVKIMVAPQNATVCGVAPDDSIGTWDPNTNQAAFEGTVVDEAGKPIEGVLVDAWTWYPGNETTTDRNGHFSLAGFKDTKRIEVRFSKENYSPRLIVRQRLGVRNAVIVLNNRTYFEGKVLDTDGRPAGNALIRAAQGPKEAEGVMITEIWTETRTDEQGKYRLYLQPDSYDIRVNAPGVGVARLAKMIIGTNEPKALDITLKPAPTFLAEVIDSNTGEPVAGVRLFNWFNKDVNGLSDANGLVTIPGMLPGKFEFSVESSKHARWWSKQCLSEWSRFMIDDERAGWQRNFDYLDFEIKDDMPPVTIIVEKGVRIRGRIVDPRGNSVEGATAAPARTGSGNSLTGDTRFSVTTKPDGTFEMLLPASGKCQYNLVAHDGDYEQWRTWANGVTAPFKTVPGQEINDVVIQLTKPVTIKGCVTDGGGKPIAGRKVRAHAADKLENRYYDPTVMTDANGNYELKFVRPTKQFIQVEPFWLTAEEAPSRGSRVVDAQSQEMFENVDFILQKGD